MASRRDNNVVSISGDGGGGEAVVIPFPAKKKGLRAMLSRLISKLTTKGSVTVERSDSDGSSEPGEVPVDFESERGDPTENSLVLEKIQTPVIVFRFAEKSVLIRKLSLDSTTYLSNFVPIILSDGTIVNVHFSNDNEGAFPTLGDIEASLGRTFDDPHSIAYCGSISQASQWFLSDCLSKKLKADQLFVRWCLQRELSYLEGANKDYQEKGANESNASSTKAGPKLLRQDFLHFERLKLLVVEERKFGNYFKDDLQYGNLAKAMDKFLDLFAGLHCDQRLFKALHGKDSIPEGRVFSRAEDVFYGFDPLVPLTKELVKLSTKRKDFFKFKKTLIKDVTDQERFASIIEREHEAVLNVLRIFGEWTALRDGWAYDVDMEKYIELPACPNRYREFMIGSNGKKFEREIHCCRIEETVVKGKPKKTVVSQGLCCLGSGVKPDYCTCF